MGAHALKLESRNKEYEPKKRGKRMLCLSSLPSLRTAFILKAAVDFVTRATSGFHKPSFRLVA